MPCSQGTCRKSVPTGKRQVICELFKSNILYDQRTRSGETPGIEIRVQLGMKISGQLLPGNEFDNEHGSYGVGLAPNQHPAVLFGSEAALRVPQGKQQCNVADISNGSCSLRFERLSPHSRDGTTPGARD